MAPMDANQMRRAFTDFFVQRGHAAVSSSPLIPIHPTAPMFTNAGMNQFVPYFLREEDPPYPRATSVQKVAVEKGSPLVAGELIADAARITGGGGNAKAADIGVAGGKDPSKIDDAIAAVRAKLGIG